MRPPKLRISIESYGRDEGGEIRVTAPDGWAIEPGELHEQVHAYGPAGWGFTYQEALAAAQEDKRSIVLKPCNLPDCDWCNEPEEAPVDEPEEAPVAEPEEAPVSDCVAFDDWRAWLRSIHGDGYSLHSLFIDNRETYRAIRCRADGHRFTYGPYGDDARQCRVCYRMDWETATDERGTNR